MLARLRKDLEQARRDRNVIREIPYNIEVALLSTLIGEIEKMSKDKANSSVDDGRVIKLIQKFDKDIDEVIKYAKKDTPAYVKAYEEKMLLSAYLPKKLTEEETEVAIQMAMAGLILSGSEVSVGTVMKQLKEQYGVRLDGALASRMLKK